jgi:hypothetical protein
MPVNYIYICTQDQVLKRGDNMKIYIDCGNAHADLKLRQRREMKINPSNKPKTEPRKAGTEENI